MPEVSESSSPELRNTKQNASELVPLSSDEHMRISQGEPPVGGKVIGSLLISSGTAEPFYAPAVLPPPNREGHDVAH